MPGRSGIAGLPACGPQPVGQFGHGLWPPSPRSAPNDDLQRGQLGSGRARLERAKRCSACAILGASYQRAAQYEVGLASRIAAMSQTKGTKKPKNSEIYSAVEVLPTQTIAAKHNTAQISPRGLQCIRR